MNSAQLLRRALIDTGIPGGSETVEQMVAFLSLLQKWSARVNLTGSLEWEIVGPLFEEAIWASEFYPDERTTHLDIGTGAGFPVIPLKIMKPHMQAELVESRFKRAVFLETVVRELGLTVTSVHNQRAEEYLAAPGGMGWDCVSWKGIKLTDEILLQLLARTDDRTQFWMFHGNELAVETPIVAERKLSLVERKSFPGKRQWFLSIYQKRSSDCFT